jgi:rhodanese-related sulfurtransferase
MGNVNIISTKELKQRLEKDTNFQFWNVLTDEYFKGEIIPGSRRVPLDQIGREVSQEHFPKDAEFIVYCGGPKCPQSMYAAKKLTELGYTNVKAYEGGIEEWKNDGNNIARLEQSTTA